MGNCTVCTANKEHNEGHGSCQQVVQAKAEAEGAEAAPDPADLQAYQVLFTSRLRGRDSGNRWRPPESTYETTAEWQPKGSFFLRLAFPCGALPALGAGPWPWPCTATATDAWCALARAGPSHGRARAGGTTNSSSSRGHPTSNLRDTAEPHSM